jgi:anti-sigma B factor antagonist
MTAADAVGALPVSVVEVNPGREVVVVGRLDVHTVADVRRLLHQVLDRGDGDLLIRLTEAEVADATGLGVIVGMHHRARRLERRLVLVDVPPRLERLLRSTRLHRVLARATSADAGTVVPLTA